MVLVQDKFIHVHTNVLRLRKGEEGERERGGREGEREGGRERERERERGREGGREREDTSKKKT